MEISKETLNKTLQVLESEISELLSAEKEIYLELKKVTFDNFRVDRIERCYKSFEGEDDNYEVMFRHINIDYGFGIYSSKEIDTINWSSWSYSYIKPEEIVSIIKKSKAYIEAVHESLIIMEDTTEIMKVVNDVCKKYKEQIVPLSYKVYDLQKERDSIQNEIINLDNKELVNKAFELFKNPIYLYRGYNISKNNTIYKIQVEKVKDKIKIIMNNRNKTISEYELLCIYNHTIKYIVTYTTDRTKDYNTEGSYNYTKCSNMYLTQSEANSPIRVSISKDEYLTLKGGR